MDDSGDIHTLSWFEIPVNDIQRAVRFYTSILDATIDIVEPNPGYPMAHLPRLGGVGGALVQGEGYAPSSRGIIIYLNCGTALDAVLARVEPAGGKILKPKTRIGETNYAAFVLDTEGNKIGLFGRE